MKKESIRENLMKNLGLTSEQVKKLIHIYAVNNKGKINAKKIEEEVKTIANLIIKNVPYLYNNYDIGHELLDCGKDRQENAMYSMLMEEGYKLAVKYLPNRWSVNVDEWVRMFYDTAKKEFSKILDGDIDSYRKFVNSIGYKNINRLAEFFNMEDEIAKYIIREGEFKDFQILMTDERPVRDSDKAQRRSCPSKLSKKIYESLKNTDSNENIRFSRKNIMRILSKIHNKENLTEEQKEELQEKFIENLSSFSFDRNLVTILNMDNLSEYETIKFYMENAKGKVVEEKNKMFLNILQNKLEEEMLEEYRRLIEELNQIEENDELNIEALRKKITESKLYSNHNILNLHRDDKDGSAKLSISIPLGNNYYFKNPDEDTCKVVSDLDIILEATELKDFIDKVNDNSRRKAQEKMGSIVENGIGEIKLVDCDYRMDREIEESEEKIIGFLEKGTASPYITYDGINGLEVTIPYKLISDLMGVRIKTIKMSEEEKEKFNNKNDIQGSKKDSYMYGKIDGYYRRDVYDFELSGEEFHIRDADWTNGGRYTIVWKGQDKFYPDEGIGISTSRSEWARFQTGIDELKFIKFATQLPLRFKKYYEKLAEESDCCGLFPTAHIENICREILRMPTEKELSEEKFAQEILEKQKEIEELSEKKEKASELLTEYEEIDDVENIKREDI